MSTGECRTWVVDYENSGASRYRKEERQVLEAASIIVKSQRTAGEEVLVEHIGIGLQVRDMVGGLWLERHS